MLLDSFTFDYISEGKKVFNQSTSEERPVRILLIQLSFVLEPEFFFFLVNFELKRLQFRQLFFKLV